MQGVLHTFLQRCVDLFTFYSNLPVKPLNMGTETKQ